MVQTDLFFQTKCITLKQKNHPVAIGTIVLARPLTYSSPGGRTPSTLEAEGVEKIWRGVNSVRKNEGVENGWRVWKILGIFKYCFILFYFLGGNLHGLTQFVQNWQHISGDAWFDYDKWLIWGDLYRIVCQTRNLTWNGPQEVNRNSMIVHSI